jgi:hypothetical protein
MKVFSHFALPSLTVMILVLLGGCSLPEHSAPTDARYQVSQGDRYYYGTSVKQDLEVAARWYNLAARQGNPEGEFYLARCYSRGDGVPKNYVEAAKWYRLAALQGNPDAQHQLGRCYLIHEGVEKNNTLAYMWLNLAATTGNESARQDRDAVAQRMTDAEITTAQRLSREWSPGFSPKE